MIPAALRPTGPTCSRSCAIVKGDNSDFRKVLYCTTPTDAEPACSSCHNGCGCQVAYSSAFAATKSFALFPMGPLSSVPKPATCSAICPMFGTPAEQTACLQGQTDVLQLGQELDDILTAQSLGKKCADICGAANGGEPCGIVCPPGARWALARGFVLCGA